jgi:hypothetical protein
MKGDFSRETFNARKHYAGVLMQQGRVQLDADWNEQTSIVRYRAEIEAADVIGACGAPEAAPGFEIATDGTQLLIGAGRFYVDGILCENDDQLPFDQQPDLPNVASDDVLKALEQAGTPFGIAYLDVWQRHVTALDDSLLREQALGGPDTTTRIKTVWQVKVLPVDAGNRTEAQRHELLAEQKDLQAKLDELKSAEQSFSTQIDQINARLDLLPASSIQRKTLLRSLQQAQTRLQQIQAEEQQMQAKLADVQAALEKLRGAGQVSCGSSFAEWDSLFGDSGMLNARTQPVDAGDDPCILPPSAGYRRLENQLYRVEIHDGGPLGTATFKWSRDNGTVVTTVERISGSVITVHDLGPDETLGYAHGQWVEISDDALELNGKPGQLAQIDTINAATREITLLNVTPQPLAATESGVDPARHPKLRRWDQVDQSAATATDHGITTSTEWLPLEDGVAVQFSGDSYRSGDYWLIPARTATGEIEWPPFDVPNTAPLPQPPLGIRHHYCRLALLQLNDGELRIAGDCRTIFPPLTERSVAPALHVTATNWRNDDLFDTRTIVSDGLRITLDGPPNALALGDASVIVTIETPPQNQTNTTTTSPFLQSMIIRGDVTIDSNNPNVIVWKIAQQQQRGIRAALEAAGLPAAAASRSRRARSAAAAAPTVAAPTGATRLRVTLKGPVIWSDIGTRRLYLDGQAFGMPGQRTDGQTPCTALSFPSGSNTRAADFESWLYIGGEQRTTALQVARLRFMSMDATGAAREVVAVNLPTTQSIKFTANDRVSVIEMTFSRAVQNNGFNKIGTPQSARVAILSGNQEKSRVAGDLTLDGAVARFQARDPSVLSASAYRLTILGSDQQQFGPGVRAADDGSQLDGNFDNQTGDDFTLDFAVS